MIRSVWIVAREYGGIAGAGGIKDVTQGLASALTRKGIVVTVVLPRYAFIQPGVDVCKLDVALGSSDVQVQVQSIVHDRIRIFLLDHPHFSTKHAVYTYSAEEADDHRPPGSGHQDVHEMNVLMQKSVLALSRALGEKPSLIHGHDGHSALIPVFMRKGHEVDREYFRSTASLTTIHNAGRAYQQNLPGLEIARSLTGLSSSVLSEGVVDGEVNVLLLAGLHGHLNTVSPGYARELLSGRDPESRVLGHALRHAGVPLPGLINGLDTEVWAVPEFDAQSVDSRNDMKHHVLQGIRLQDYGSLSIHGIEPPPFGEWVFFHGRLTPQKGVGLFIDALEALHLRIQETNHRFVILGQGEPALEKRLRHFAESTSNVFFLNGYNHNLARDLFAACSFIAVPSLWEPCGQTDMIGQFLGTIPIVRYTGGLKKVRHRRTGFVCKGFDAVDFGRCMARALELAENDHPLIRKIRTRAEKEIYGRRTWDQVLVQGYLPLYESIRYSKKNSEAFA